MHEVFRNSVLSTLGLLAGLLIPIQAFAQEVEQPPGARQQKGPSKADWVAAGLDPAEYSQALEYGVGIDEWKELERSRKNHTTAGWACVGVGVLGGGVVATLWLTMDDWDLKSSPDMEVFVISMVAVGATILTGFVVALSAPGPEEFVEKWRRDKGLSFEIGSTTLTPGPLGMTLTF